MAPKPRNKPAPAVLWSEPQPHFVGVRDVDENWLPGKRAQFDDESDDSEPSRGPNGTPRLAKLISSEPQPGDPEPTPEHTAKVLSRLDEYCRKGRDMTDASAENWVRIFKKIDTDESGDLSFDEIAELTRHILQIPKKVVSDGDVRALWAMLDADQSGGITVAEFIGHINRQKRLAKKLKNAAAGSTPPRQRSTTQPPRQRAGCATTCSTRSTR